MSNEHVAVHGGQRPASVPGAGAGANECDLSCRSPPLGALGVVAMGALAAEASRVETMMFGLLVSAV